MASGGSSSGPIDALLGWFGSKLGIAIGTALATLGTGGLIVKNPNIVLNESKIQEIARPDPWYGWQGRENRHLIDSIDSELDTIRASVNGQRLRVEKLEQDKRVYDLHMKEASGGYERIRACERKVDVSVADRRLLWEELRRIQNQLRN